MDDNIYIDLEQTHLQPGQHFSGKILWALEKAPKEVRLILGWVTEGRGTSDHKTEAELSWTTEATNGEETFEFTLPASPYSFDNFPATGAEMPTGIRGVFLQMMNGASNLRLWTEERKARHLEKMAARQRAEREFARTGVWSSHHPGGFRRVAHHSCGKIACDEREDEGCPICRKEGKIEKYGSGCDEYGCQLEKPIPVTGLYGSSTDPPAPPGKE